MARSTRKKSRRRSQPASKGGPVPAARPLDQLLAAVRRDPEDLTAAMALAEYYLGGNQHHKIPEVLERFVSSYPAANTRTRRAFNIMLAYGYVAAARLEQAESLVTREKEQFPESLDFWNIEAYLHLSFGRFGEAVTCAERYIDLWNSRQADHDSEPAFAVTDGHYCQALNMLGSAHMELHHATEAIDAFRRAIDADRTNHLPYLNLARMLARLNRKDEALATLACGREFCRQVQELQMMEQGLHNNATVSACLMVKNEQEQLGRCLDSIRNWVDEIIVVDTGSTDDTVEIARSYGAQVYFQPWEGDFSKHRNFSIEQATSDWIFIIDADEELVNEDIPKIRPVLNDKQFGLISIDVYNIYTDGRNTQTFLPSIRFFRRDLNLRYDGIVHNQLQFSPDTPIARVGARVRHYGYSLSREKMEQKTARTRGLLEKQLAENPDDTFALFNFVQLLRSRPGGFDTEDAPAIINAAKRVVELTDPADTTYRHLHLMSLNHLAWSYFYLSDFDEALVWAHRALAIRADYLDPQFLLGHIHSQAGRFDQAEREYRKYIDVQAAYDPSTETENLILLHVDSRAEAWYGLALMAHAGNNVAVAESCYRKVVELRAGYLEAASRLGQLCLERGDLEQARSYFALQGSAGETNCIALMGLAYIARLESDFDAAERFYRAAIDHEEKNHTARLKLARMYCQLERFEQAGELFAEVARDGEQNPEVLGSLAQTYFETGRFSEAAEIYRTILMQTNPTAATFNDLGNCYFKTGDYQQAERCYREALEIAPRDLAANRNLGVVLARSGKPHEAIKALQAALEGDDTQLNLAPVIGDLHCQLRQWPEALPYYERYLRQYPSDTLALFHMSDCYLHMGHADSAIMGYRRVIQLDDTFAPARERLAQLQSAGEGVEVSH